MTDTPFREWIGRTETSRCLAAREPIDRLADLLDHHAPPWSPDEVPPLGHWLYFTPRARSSEIDIDGHPKRGGFLPPVALPRRMWAGGRLTFHAPTPMGRDIQRRSEILNIRRKVGGTGELVFVTVRHEIRSADIVTVSEEQDIVYRGPASPGGSPAPPPAEPRAAETERTVTLGPAELFRYSSLTFNSHRIHYDRDYATQVEGYAGLVVQGPFLATLLLDLLLRNRPGATIRSFAFRGLRPLTDTAPFTLCLARDGAKIALWSRDAAGHETMAAQAVLSG